MALSALAVRTPPLAASETIGIELNRIEDQGANCRAYLVITNPGEIAFSGFKLDLVIFSGSGTITRRLALDLAPLRAAKTSVKVFDITDTSGTVLDGNNDGLAGGTAIFTVPLQPGRHR